MLRARRRSYLLPRRATHACARNLDEQGVQGELQIEIDLRRPQSAAQSHRQRTRQAARSQGGGILTGLYDVLAACNQWIRLHPYTTSDPSKAKPKEGIKYSNRRKGIEQLITALEGKIEPMVKELDKKEAEKLVPGNKNDPRNDKSRAAFHQELLAATIKRAEKLGHDPDDFNAQQIGFIAAKSALKLDAMLDKKNQAACKIEAMRVLSILLGRNKELAKRFQDKGVEVVVVPANRPMTDLPEFSSLKGVKVDQAGGTARTWDPTRGVGGLEVNGKVYVAVTEENLLRTKVTGDAKSIGGGCYAAKYSTTAHEFFHGLHLYAIKDEEKKVITKAFEDRRKGVTIDYTKKQLVITDKKLKVSQQVLDEALTTEWVDGPRRKKEKLGSQKQYAVVYEDGTKVKSGNSAAWYLTEYEPQDCYAAFDDREYFAQVACCYMGTNGGTDPYTGNPRHNDPAWVRKNEPAERVELLDALFGAAKDTAGGNARLPDTNEVDDVTVAELLADPKTVAKILNI